MDSFIEIHTYLLENLHVPMRRKLMDHIDWSHRLIGIKGTRGIGKTTFLLDFAKSHYGFSKSCLYVNLNNLYFTEHTIIEFADEFRKTGGKTLILDQVYKYPGWSEELKYCYDHFEDLQIIFSGSTVMRLRAENPHLRGIVHSYKLEGFSFREFLELKTGHSFDSYTLEDLLDNHHEIAKTIVEKVRPLAYFNDYLQFGYYPFFLDNSSYSESLMKNINFILEIDISFLRQIELKYLPRLRKLLFLVAQSAPFQPNVSKLSSDIGTSRATVMNYLYYLRQARLIKLLYDGKEDMQKKPSMVYLHNPNLMYALMRGAITKNTLHKTFFYNQLGCKNDIVSSEFADFMVNNEQHFFVCEKQVENKNENSNFIVAQDMIETGSKGVIPLWLFGFLY